MIMPEEPPSKNQPTEKEPPSIWVILNEYNKPVIITLDEQEARKHKKRRDGYSKEFNWPYMKLVRYSPE